MAKPFVLIISGVAGSGKDSLIEELWKHPELFEVAVSYTDRPMRPGEIDGKNYHYISKSDFDAGIKNKEFIEWEKVRGEYRYGRKKADLKRALKSDKTVVMSVEPLGMMKFRQIYDVVSVFITPPSMEEAITRLKKRGNDTPEGLKDRMDRYTLELSYKDRYDHIIVNDDLNTARKELLKIAKNERENHQQRRTAGKLLFGLLAVLLFAGSALAYNYSIELKRNKNTATVFPPGISGQKSDSKSNQATTPVAVTPSPLPSAEAKKKVAATPPKKPTAEKIATATTTNTDGSTTTTVSTGGAINQSALTILESEAPVSSPLNLPYIDDTGKYPTLGGILDNYLNSTLKWRNEISAMKGVLLMNAGNSGWNGQYLGNYTTSGTGPEGAPVGGKITSASGAIVLNTYYIETQYCSGANNFSGCPAEYAKLFLSHEYGHHYTLYHKWIDWNLPSGTRFPDSYYNVRPLTKNTTATDYSLGWSNCEIEIIAEDYSYLYSGYGLQAMHGTYGYPSASTKTWLDNIGAQSQLPQTVAPPVNLAPTVAITAPADSTIVSGNVDFTADASDDAGVSSVSFYVGNKLISTDTSAPYATIIPTAGYDNGVYILKAIASDGTLTAEKTVSVTFSNRTVDTTNPAISIIAPTDNPHTLTGNNVSVSIMASDNVAIDRIELYFNDQFQQSWKTDSLNLTISFKGLSAGTYTLKFKTFDTSGNSAETILTTVKQ